MKLSSLLQRIGFLLTLATAFLTPLFFLPLTTEYYEFNKQALLAVTALVSFVLLTWSFMVEKQVRLTRSPFGLPLLALAASWLLSTFLKTPNRIDAFLEPGSTTSIVALVIFFFTAINFIRTREELDRFISTLITSVSILAVVSLIWGSGIGEKIFPVPFLKSPYWTPTGNTVSTIALLVGFVPFLAITIAKTREQTTRTLVLAISLFLCIIAAAVFGYRTFKPTPGTAATPAFVPQQASWAIALEALKSSPILGTGPSTYLTSFTRFRPINYNATNLWNIRFSSAGNYYLHLLTTVGVLGLASFLFLSFRSLSLFIRVLRSSAPTPLHTLSLSALTSVVLILISQLFIPGTLTILAFVFFLLVIATVSLKLAGSSLVHDATFDIVAASDSGTKSPLLPAISFSIALLIAVPSLYLGGRAYFAEMVFQNAILAAGTNDGKKTYDTLNEAIRINPYKDTFRLAYSQTNLLLANAIAAKKDLTDDDRNIVTQLIQQSIREAKNSVALNPGKVTNLENLAVVYRNLIGLAQGAETWTIASYQQAISVDPVNPNLHIALGGVLYSLKNYDDAIRIFRTAVDLKPNLANAHYNLAAAYREKGEYAQAFTSLQTVLNLVDRSSADYTKTQAELDDLRKKLGEAAASSAPAAPAKTELTAPEPLPSPKLNPQIKLPSELGPEASPTPTPQP